VPIPFDDGDEFGSGLGNAAFLRVSSSPEGGCSLGALLVINARGEPLEFAYNRVRVPQPFLWREADLRRYVQRRLTASLLSVCVQQPRLLVCLDDEVGLWLFSRDLRLEVPVARIAPIAPSPRRIDATTGEVLEEQSPTPPHVAWQPSPPDEGSDERQLFEHLSVHGLLLEPFGRAAVGLREVYGEHAMPSVGD
jgi:hypothetical protein